MASAAIQATCSSHPAVLVGRWPGGQDLRALGSRLGTSGCIAKGPMQMELTPHALKSGDWAALSQAARYNQSPSKQRTFCTPLTPDVGPVTPTAEKPGPAAFLPTKLWDNECAVLLVCFFQLYWDIIGSRYRIY